MRLIFSLFVTRSTFSSTISVFFIYLAFASLYLFRIIAFVLPFSIGEEESVRLPPRKHNKPPSIHGWSCLRRIPIHVHGHNTTVVCLVIVSIYLKRLKPHPPLTKHYFIQILVSTWRRFSGKTYVLINWSLLYCRKL